MRFSVVVALAAVACSSSPAVETTAELRQPIIGGRPSGDDENAAVFIRTRGDSGKPDDRLECSGRIIAPGLVVTARHCLLERRSGDVRCKPDGSPVDIGEQVDTRPRPPDRIKVYVGSNKSAQREIAVREVLSNLDVTLCRSDIAYLVLVEAGLDERTPIRRAPPAVGETVSISGWGFVSDADRTKTPDTRATIETKVTEIGPAFIPAGTFALAGRTVCLGDSGAAALTDGALVGAYSRIDGDPGSCELALGRNIFTAVMAHPELLSKAFAAIGEEPWFAGEQRPWLAKTGAACTADDQCRSGGCDGAVCRAGCGPTGLACKAGETCSAETCVPAPAAAPATPADEPSSSCEVARRPPSSASALLVVVAAALSLRVRGRRRRSPAI